MTMPPQRAEASRPTRRRVKGFLDALLALGVLWSVQPAMAQPASDAPKRAMTENAAQDPAAQAPPPSDPWRAVKFGATLEALYQYNWNRPPDRSVVLRAYDTRANTFSIQQVAIVMDAAPDLDAGRRYGARVDLQFGMATDTVQGSPANEPRPEAYRHLWQAFGTYVLPVGANGLHVDAGKYASLLGYETNYAKDNQAFSRAYLFNFLPFYHSGVRLTLPVNDRVSLLYMLSNGIQQTEDFNDFKSSHVAAILKPAPRVTWVVNYYVGQEQPDGGQPGGPDGFFRVFDTSVTVTPARRLSLALDVNHVTNELTTDDPSSSLQGLGAYARYQATATTALGVRYERLDDEGLFGGLEQMLQEATLTAEWKPADGFLVRGEFRRDWSNARFFPGGRGGTDLRRSQNAALIGGVWWFGNKQGPW
jgi:Putative beta-barrel porin-2, OmpL-like. bbp2